MINIALFGKTGVGKTFVANRFAEIDTTCVRISISQKIKNVVKRSYPNIWNSNNAYKIRKIYLKVEETGKREDKDFWLKRTMKSISELNKSCIRAVVDDCRLPQEADFLKKCGFMTVCVLSPQGRFDMCGVSERTIRDKKENRISSIHFDEVIYNERVLDVVDYSIKSILAKAVKYNNYDL